MFGENLLPCVLVNMIDTIHDNKCEPVNLSWTFFVRCVDTYAERLRHNEREIKLMNGRRNVLDEYELYLR